MGEVQSLSNEHQLWANFSSHGVNIFAGFFEISKNMLAEVTFDSLEFDDSFDLILPSDEKWQTKIYYKLVEQQRIADNASEKMLESINKVSKEKLHDWNIIPRKRLNTGCKVHNVKKFHKINNLDSVTWTISDIAKAGCLLSVPLKQTSFEDEQEMRRIYTLIYNVFRYKNVLKEALNEVLFYQLYPKLMESNAHVWLLFYDLYYRGFKKRDSALVSKANTLFEKVDGLIEVEKALWSQRIKLAASIARLRIQNNALSLSELLPSHLRDEKTISQTKDNPVTYWININKVKNIDEVKKYIEKTFTLTAVDDIDDLEPDNFHWDKHCPQIVAFHASMRPILAKSRLVRNYSLIVQDKSFCLGPATFGKIITNLQLTGNVIQTHVNSPRTTAYLANLLSQNEKIKKLMAFNAGKRKLEYEEYFHQLGFTNILIYSEGLIDVSLDSAIMEEVVAVFATPPNTYSAVNDPIDLVCSRGGDLSMLEILTESDETKEGKVRILEILEEQKKTLRFAMSRPQTHSEVDAENGDMVEHSMIEVNRRAKLQHVSLNKELDKDKTAVSEINNNDGPIMVLFNKDETDKKIPIMKKISLTQKIPYEDEEELLKNITVPDTDIFNIHKLPILCPNEDSCLNLTKEGCFLALLQRKQVIKLDNKYMIQMAENRGLFGKTSPTNSKLKNSKTKKKQEYELNPPKKSKKRLKESEITRIAAPTHSFLCHTRNMDEIEICHRLVQDINDDLPKPNQKYRVWWRETTNYLTTLRSSLVKNKIIPSKQITQINNAQQVLNIFKHNSCRIDEVVAKNNSNIRIPLFPRLKLSRETNKVEKIVLTLPKTSLTFSGKRIQKLTFK